MKQLFTDGWTFAKLPLFTGYAKAHAWTQKKADAQPRTDEPVPCFAPVRLPHDWAIFDPASFYEDADGWYRKVFSCEKDEALCYILRFEGVYMDSEIYVNGEKAYEWKYGYSTFDVELTRYLHAGDNEIMVGVHYQNPNSRWYSGAGIYRNVWLFTLPRAHLALDGVYLSAREADGGYRVTVQAEVAMAEAQAEDPAAARAACRTSAEAKEAADTAQMLAVICRLKEQSVSLALCESSAERAVFCGEMFLKDARVWDLDDPYLYELTCELWRGSDAWQNGALTRQCGRNAQADGVIEQQCIPQLLETEAFRFGCRTVELRPQEGFFLNHRHLKLNGVCLHHDLGALGAAVHPDAIRRQLRIMKEMGANAVRTSHNMPAVELMELADEMGLLVLSEAFDMWELSKTQYDYARFFPQWYKRDVASWVRRDRNHPSLILWSLGNEIYDMHAGERGQEVTRMLMEEVLLHDPNQNGLVTFGSNYMPWENAQHCAKIVKIPGYNYSENYYNEHHEKHPDWVIYGSETSSTVQSRGVYHFPLEQPMLSDVDEQCSALGNSTTSWGAKNSESCVIAERDHPFSLGQFLWSGFDYIGEPTPYHTKNSYFGQVDTAGFPKDPYYLYQAQWTDPAKKTVVHLLPYWDFNDGQTVDVRIYTNAPYAELLLNGRSYGKQFIDHAHGARLSADYKVAYEPGEITAVVYDDAGNELARESRHSFRESAEVSLCGTDADGNPVAIRRIILSGTNTDGSISAEWNYELAVTQKQLLFFEIGMLDADGYPVENANDRIRVSVSGNGRLLGLDNGDSTDMEPYQANCRRLFNGKLLAIVEAGTAENVGTNDAGNLTEPEKASDENKTLRIRIRRAQEENCRIRKIELLREPRNLAGADPLTPQAPESVVAVKLLPLSAAGQPVEYEIVEKDGIVSDLAEIAEHLPVTPEERENGIAEKLVIRARGDGSFRLRAIARNGAPQAKVLSVLDDRAEGFGPRHFNPYRMVWGALYNDAIGEPGNGNEHGVATARDGRTVVGFRGVDFGPVGSDQLTLPVFELDGSKTQIDLWLGRPKEAGSRRIDTLFYEKPSIWNVYQEETYRLPERLTGVCDLYFELHTKIHLQGFYFKETEDNLMDTFTLAAPWKKTNEANPIATQRYSADPGVMVYDDTIYVFATDDTVVTDPETGEVLECNYGVIKTINCFASKDFVNWTDLGRIPVAGENGIAKWAANSWAPAAAHKTIDGKEKFFLYFANNGSGVGVLEADDPKGPWRDSVGHALVTHGTENCGAGVPWCFDPAVLVDDDGCGYLYFGGGVPEGKADHPKSSRVVKLGDDMVSLAGVPVEIDAPYIFEDSCINKINGKYYYSYCSNWNTDGQKMTNAAIEYMTSDSPMGPFTYAGEVFKNPGVYFEGSWGNNHHTIFSFEEKLYLAYHTRTLEIEHLGKHLGYRSTHINEITVKDGVLEDMPADRKGIPQSVFVNPYEEVRAATIATQAGISIRGVGDTIVTDIESGDWTSVRGVDFGKGTSELLLSLKAEHPGRVLIRIGDPDGASAGTAEVCATGGAFAEFSVGVSGLEGVKDIYFVFDGSMEFEYWKATEA